MNRSSAKRVLVTGGTGFLGSRVVHRYAQRGAHVRVVSRRRGELPEAAGLVGSVEFVELDLCDSGAFAADVFSDRDLVIHAAAQVTNFDGRHRPNQHRINVEGTQNVIEACLRYGVRRFLHVSTCAAIGISADPNKPADEQFDFNLGHLDWTYNLAKHAAESLVLSANESSFETIVVNPGFVFGWDGRRYRGSEVIERVLSRPIVLCTEGGLSIVQVDDVVEGILCAADTGQPGRRYILSGENLSFRQIADVVCLVSGRQRLIISLPRLVGMIASGLMKLVPSERVRQNGIRLADLQDYPYRYYSSERARRELGYEPRSFAKIVADALRKPEQGARHDVGNRLARDQPSSQA